MRSHRPRHSRIPHACAPRGGRRRPTASLCLSSDRPGADWSRGAGPPGHPRSSRDPWLQRTQHHPPLQAGCYPAPDRVVGDSRALGAVNTVLFKDGKRIGYNTDWNGFAEPFRRKMADVKRDRVVQLGAGGAAAAVGHAALTLGVTELTIFDLDAARAEQLAAKLSAHFGAGRAKAGQDLATAMQIGRRAHQHHTGRHGVASRHAPPGGSAAP